MATNVSLDEFYSLQERAGKDIEKFYVNYSKLSTTDRKNLLVVNKKITTICEMVNKFNETHELIVNAGGKSSDNYFSVNYKDYINQHHENNLDKLLSDKKSIEEAIPEIPFNLLPPRHRSSSRTSLLSDTPAYNIQSDNISGKFELTRLLKQQTNAMTILNEKMNKVEARMQTQENNIACSVPMIEIYVEDIHFQWNKITDYHRRILFVTSGQSEDYNINLFSSMEDRVEDLIARLVLRKRAEETASNSNGFTSNVESASDRNRDPDLALRMVHLPKIDIPKFDGDYLKWQAFKNLFTDMIDNAKISDAQKLFYLKSSLTGEAKAMVNIMDINLDKYKSAWERLQNKYDNERILTSVLAERLFSQPTIKNESASALRELKDISRECISSLKTLKVDSSACEALIVFLLIKKIDPKSRELFEHQLEDPKKNPSLEIFFNFLDRRSQALESMGNVKKFVISSSTKSSHATTSESKDKNMCLCCKEKHQLWDCKKFNKLDVRSKFNFVFRNRICCRCLTPGHPVQQCQRPKCDLNNCGKNHHPLLHKDYKKVNTKDSHTSEAFEGLPGKTALSLCNESKLSAATCSDKGFVFLGTAVLKVKNSSGVEVNCRALLDSCSQLSIISLQLSRKLGLQMIPDSTKISGVGNGRTVSNGKVVVHISNADGSFRAEVECVVLSSVTTYSPVEHIDIGSPNISLADLNFSCPDSVDMLLGCDVYSKLLRKGVKNLGNGLPDLVNTVFGWVVMGPYIKSSHQSSPFCGISAEEADFYLNAPKLWEMDDDISSKGCLSLDDQRVEYIFQKSTVRSNDGRFIVTLPKLEDRVPLGNSYKAAFQRFLSLERKFSKDTRLFKRYYNFLNEYLQLGHMVKTDLTQVPKDHYFLPHHAVFKENSSTTKIRVVFDGSCKTDSNVSLNDTLYKGPTLQDDIFDLLLRFRIHQFVVCADIAKMFRQVWVNEGDQFNQLILWRNKPSDPIGIYRLKTITYGTAPATYLATKCIQTLAAENQEKFPESSQVLLKDMYVDDLISGANDIDALLKIQKEVCEILSSGGFHLRKWSSNDIRLLENIPYEDREVKTFQKEDANLVKTLGISWEPQSDLFSLVIQDYSSRNVITKRIITAEAGCVYDPLGFVSPVLLKAKMLIQLLWRRKFDWDAPLPEEIANSWKGFRSNVQLLKELKIPRFVCSQDIEFMDLHGFSDASKSAYGAVIYVRSTSNSGEVSVKLFTSRSRVSPIRDMSIPRLELAAAKLLTDLMTKVRSSLRCNLRKIYYWTDSQVVLWWLKKPSSSFKPYVANRISHIQELTKVDDWHHTPGDQNPADILSRGATVPELLNSALWFNGPSFLLFTQQNWPPQNAAFDFPDDNPQNEMKKNAVVMISTKENFDSSNMFQVSHRNSFSTLQRIVGFIVRFGNNCRNRTIENSVKKTTYDRLQNKVTQRDTILDIVAPLSVDELDCSLKYIVRYLQHALCDIKSSKSELAKLLPFVDNEGVVRVGGRLKNASIPFEAKHPMLLPKCKITLMLIRQIHRDNHHVPPQTLLSIVRQKFWPVSGARSCTKIFYHCIKCFRAQPREIKQLMGNLPQSRTDRIAVFANTGVDFAGPVKVHYEIRGKRPTTAYVAVFVCFAVKAVHLELVSNLSTPAFMGALKRFIARRGKPLSIYSDNGTNFIGCNNELKRVKEFLEKKTKKIKRFAALRGISWKPIPPGSPHFGGLWESSVKRMKKHLVHSLQNQKLTFEELNTVLIEIEAILNSRPLTYQSENPADVKPLTPNDFLITGDSNLIPEEDKRNVKPHLIKRWEIVSKIRQEYWQRLSLEYFHTLQERSKWLKLYDNLQPNTVVLIKNKNAPPTQWEMGLITEAIKGNDDVVRVVDVKTPLGVKRRAITKVCPFPPLDENSMFTWNDEKSSQKNLNTSSQTSSTELCTSSTMPGSNPSLPISKSKSSEQRSSIKTNRKSVNLLTTVLCTFLFIPFCLAGNSVNVTKFEHHPGIYFDGVGKVNIASNEWHVVMYFNLTTYWQQCKNFNMFVNNLKKLCDNQACEQVTHQLSKRIDDIEAFNVLIRQECHMKEHLRSSGTRSRRSYRAPLNAIGSFAHRWFGVLDSDYGEKVEKALENVKGNEDRVLLLIKNQTTVMNNTVNLIKRNNKEIEEKLYRLYNESVLLENLLKSQEKRILFNTMSSSLMMSISEYEATQRQIHETLKDFKKGSLNPFLIHPSEFEDHLRTLQETIGMEYKIPSTRFAELQSVVQMATVFGSNCLIFQVEIPLLGNIDHDLYRMIPVPTYSNNVSTYVKPFQSYLAISLHMQTYYFMSTTEFETCSEFYEIRICHKKHAIFKINEDNHCEVNLFLHSPEFTDLCDVKTSRQHQFWIELHRPNQWLFALKEKSKLKSICKGEIPFQSITIQGEGILESLHNCVMMINNVELPVNRIKYSTFLLKQIPSVLPEFNISDKSEISIKETKNPFVVSLQNLDSISEDIEKLKEEEKVTLKTVEIPTEENVWGKGPDTYHIISFSSTGMILIIGITVCVYIKCFRKQQSTVKFKVGPEFKP